MTPKKQLHPSLEHLKAVQARKRSDLSGYPATDAHHLKPVGMGRNRTRPMAEHYTTLKITAIEHRALEQPPSQGYKIHYEAWKRVALDLAAKLYKRDEEGGE